MKLWITECDVPITLQDHNYSRRRISARWADAVRKPATWNKCPCCRDDQEQKHQQSATTAKLPRKRKRTSMACHSRPSAEPPEVLAPTPEPSSLAADIPRLLNLVPRSAIPPADLPVVSNMAPGSPRPSTAPLQDDGPLKIHNRSVEEYQQIYHEVVDDMLTYKDGRLRPYSLELGRRIKQKLWERLNRPTFTTSANEDGLVKVDVSYGVGVYPPLHDVDISLEPKLEQPPRKRAKN
ncbi:uncharacterized protein LOC122997107 isoform X2 [Thunnus albacares]|uniref:uncharacterized protein LOC122997107 isoform X2 n=1 Tax=Thunnus albacares TaxID=8236 RepID=UPI001CF679A0|nr:uncharacterized protein LOC122997107 isoform X2 [Thunnus albacares]